MGFVTIDGIEVEFTDERNLLTVIKKAGIDIPTLCYIDELTVVNLVASSRVYKWDAYVTDDGGKPIDEWAKIGGKTDNGKSTAAGYTLTLPEAAQQIPIRYIRIYGTYHSANCGYHITEISVVGKAA
jgi:hypothetical protein